ncbi:MAG: ferritin-like domain-containing protein [Deltaproteobacteria bacterium]|nr:ferritin-like domain-containing protein [Deltaproteobacteria bacterium]
MSDTVERWVERFICATTLKQKLTPQPAPTRWSETPSVLRLQAPGRPPELRVVPRAPRRPRSLRSPSARARLLHTFLHHELQAAELMGWALLAYADAPMDFRRGLLRILHDELRHAALYLEQVEALGHHFGEFPVRDWFWERLPSCASPLSFVASMGVGLEGGNLDHSLRFADAFREVGDEAGARAQERIGREEIAHVRFALRWFRTFHGSFDFESWKSALVPPLSPMLMRGRPLNLESRREAGLDERFLSALSDWQPTAEGPKPATI